MAKFRFRLATLRKLRVAQRDEMRAKLAEAYQAELLLEQQLETVQVEVKNQQSLQRSAIQDAAMNVNHLLETQRYLAVLRAQQSTMQGQTKLLATEVQRRRQAAIEADRQVRILDKLQERQKAEHRQKLQKAEIKELDEIAARREEVDRIWAC